jgi:hypothetical protein
MLGSSVISKRFSRAINKRRAPNSLMLFRLACSRTEANPNPPGSLRAIFFYWLFLTKRTLRQNICELKGTGGG